MLKRHWYLYAKKHGNNRLDRPRKARAVFVLEFGSTCVCTDRKGKQQLLVVCCVEHGRAGSRRNGFSEKAD